jgi:hypothetical protein
MLLNPDILYASLLWGTIGTGFCIYGKKAAAAVPLIGGFALIGLSCLITSPVVMSLASVAVIGGMCWMKRLGY